MFDTGSIETWHRGETRDAGAAELRALDFGERW
jgi:hypothetical protein